MSKDPTVQQLRCFSVLAVEMHYGRAAQRLHITQPPLTRHIQNLEQGLGISLFERRGRRIELTPAGEIFRTEIDKVLSGLDRGISLARQIANGEAGEVSIGYIEPLGIEFLPKILGPFRDLHPNHNLRLQEMHTLEQEQALFDGTIDCGLLRTLPSSTLELSFEVVWRDELVVVMSERHSLVRSTEESVRLAQLSRERFVVYDTSLGTGILSTALAACSKAGFSPAVAHTAGSTPMLLSLVAAGEGVALVSREIARVPRPGVVFRRIEDQNVSSDVLMGWRHSDASAVLKDLRHIIRQVSSR